MSKVVDMDGKSFADRMLAIQATLIKKSTREPHLVVVTVGNNDASKVYIKNKQKACEKCGIKFSHITFDEKTEPNKVAIQLQLLNYTETVDGIIFQQPVPNKFKGLEQLIAPEKDVDGFTLYNLGGTLFGGDYIGACTPKGIIELLDHFGIELTGKHVVVLGRSNIVGKPLIGMLLEKNATVTSCNSHTTNLFKITETADVLISAIGKPKFITSKYLSSNCNCVIDVGMNRDENGKLCGDIDYEDVTTYWTHLGDNVRRYITPVPGGVGPMTVYSLIKNTISAFNKKEK